MGGSEDAIESKIKEVIARFGHLNYLEIGIGEGSTLIAASDIALECKAYHTILGIDIIGGRHFDPNKFLQTPNKTVLIDNRAGGQARPYQIGVWLGGSPFSIQFIHGPLNYVLIDGCHCRECAIKDFLAIENKVPIGGIVAFHDAGISDQVNEPQCQPDRGIRVLEALAELGLQNDSRSHWKNAGTAIGERSTSFFERIP